MGRGGNVTARSGVRDEAIPEQLGDCFAPLFRNLICGADGSSAWAGKLPAATVLTSSLPYTRHARRDLLAMTGQRT